MVVGFRVVSDERGGSFYDQAAVHSRYTGHRIPSRFSPNHVMEEPAVLAAIGDPTGLRILDLGCGDARFGVHLLKAGCAEYHGVDGSQLMTDLARRSLADLPATISRVDIEDFQTPASRFDLVTARLLLHYLADLDSALAVAARCLVPGGRLVFSVVHPLITSHDTPSDGPRTTWTVDDYFQPGPRRRSWMGSTVTWQHRTVEHYVEAATRAGFHITSLRECEPVAERFDGDDDELARRRRVPLFLLISAQKS